MAKLVGYQPLDAGCLCRCIEPAAPEAVVAQHLTVLVEHKVVTGLAGDLPGDFVAEERGQDHLTPLVGLRRAENRLAVYLDDGPGTRVG